MRILLDLPRPLLTELVEPDHQLDTNATFIKRTLIMFRGGGDVSVDSISIILKCKQTFTGQAKFKSTGQYRVVPIVRPLLISGIRPDIRKNC